MIGPAGAEPGEEPMSRREGRPRPGGGRALLSLRLSPRMSSRAEVGVAGAGAGAGVPPVDRREDDDPSSRPSRSISPPELLWLGPGWTD